MPKMSFTDPGVRALNPVPGKELRFFEKQDKGRGGVSLMLNLSYSGNRSWHVLYYRNGKPSTKRLGVFPDMGVKEARTAAKKEDPRKLAASNQAGTFKTVAEEWLEDHVRRNRLRSENEIVRQLNTYIYPTWSNRRMFDIKRADVNLLLRDIEAKRIRRGKLRLGGMVMADRVLATLASLMQWFALQNDEFTPPLIRGMHRDKRPAEERSRRRVLDDDEIRAVWIACDEVGTFGASVRMLLLTGQRLSKIKRMKWTDVKDGTWTIATERREKGNAGAIMLPKLVIDILEDMPRIDGNDYLFPSADGRKYFNSFSNGKKELDRVLPEMPRWTLHDLRRTARSLMSRIGVNRDIAELVLGHKRKGVEGTYDRHAYTNEKSDALQRLADHIALILNPPDTSNVVQLGKKNPA